MPKSMRVCGPRIWTLATGRGCAVLTELDARTLAQRKQTRNLPVIHKLFLNPEGNALGFTQRHAKGNPSELCFIDPELNLVGTERMPDACTGFASQGHLWIVACRDGGLHAFDRDGIREWTWHAPPERHFQSPVFSVAANDEQIFAAEGLYLYSLTPEGRLGWDWELPHLHERGRIAIPLGSETCDPQAALTTLGLKERPAPDEIRQAYRRMARLTHPDLHPLDELAAARFRAVHDAYQSLQTETPAATGKITISVSINGGSTSTRITALKVHGSAVGIGTGHGEVYHLNDTGKLLAYHQLGRQPVYSLLLRDGSLAAAFCPPHLYRFGGDSLAQSEELPDYFVELVAHGHDILVSGWKTMWLFGPRAEWKGRMQYKRQIDAVAASGGQTLVLAGSLIAIPHG